jgi:fatty-acyl-CoA synthase
MFMTELTCSTLVAEALTRYSDRDAFVCGARRVSYREAAAITGQLNRALARHGVRRGHAVAHLGPNAPEAWLAQAASYLAGAHFTGLQGSGSVADHAVVCDDASARVLFAAESYAEHAEAVVRESATLTGVIHLSDAGGVVGEPLPGSIAVEPGSAVADDIAWMPYTGGTTGRPKGVMLSQRAMVQQTLSHLSSWGIPERPRYLAAAPISHASGLPVLPVLLRGGTVVLMPGFDPDAWLRIVQEERINYAFVVPTMIYALLDNAKPEDYHLGSLGAVAYGAAPTSIPRLLEAIDRIGPVMHQVYGQSEVAGTATSLRSDEHDPRRPERLGSCGRAVVGADVAVLNDEHVRLPIGEVGELCVLTRAAMSGYRNRPEETAESMRDGWIHTGDMAYRDDAGFFYLVDRKKDVIISGGFNVYSREVEDALAELPCVASVAVIGIPDAKWGEAVCAVVVRQGGDIVREADLIQHVRDRKGPVFAPKSIQFLDELPVTPLGKIDKKQLREPFWKDHGRNIH